MKNIPGLKALNFMKIGQAAKMLGIPVSMLRQWEKSGILEPIHKGKGGTRYYSRGQIEQKLKESR